MKTGSGRDEEPTLSSFVESIREYVEHEKDNGRMEMQVSPETVAELGSMPRAERSLTDIADEIAQCTQCGLHESRTRTVPGQGNTAPEIMFIGEGPGADEDRQGLAFVGRAGKLLTQMITAMGLNRDDVFIGNVVKCRPPDNRPPLPDEMSKCMPYLREQIAVLKPKVIVALGGTAVKGLLSVETGIIRIRGKWLSFEGVPTMPTFHPAYLLRNQSAKKDAWVDLQEVLKRLGRTTPPREIKGKTAQH
ncbi:MAG: uracil-DNA glycosylase [Lentisphaerales bacterium]|nr:MAG: uracil-DNA glycosylase [Lentisphaerales bacterium]